MNEIPTWPLGKNDTPATLSSLRSIARQHNGRWRLEALVVMLPHLGVAVWYWSRRCSPICCADSFTTSCSASRTTNRSASCSRPYRACPRPEAPSSLRTSAQYPVPVMRKGRARRMKQASRRSAIGLAAPDSEMVRRRARHYTTPRRTPLRIRQTSDPAITRMISASQRAKQKTPRCNGWCLRCGAPHIRA